jgi:hypothetical protein
MTTALAVAAAAVVTMTAATRLVAQTAPDAAGSGTLVSVAGGLAVGSPDLGGHASLSFSMRLIDVIARIAESSDLNFFSGEEKVRDIALMVGRRVRRERSWARAAAGVGIVRHAVTEMVECGPFFFCSFDETVTTGAGLALQVDAVWAPIRSLGLGNGALANVNGQQMVGGLTVSLHLGRLR